jgi:hypothetical protein
MNNQFLFLIVYGKEDNIESDAEVDDEDEPVLRPDETTTPATDILV